jgi:6-pyruvoyltetrahydropterin/6-carboxytetrahydropterin synthase
MITNEQELMVVKEITFDAAHHLPNYDGPCARVHGHLFKLQVGLKGVVDSISGMVVDFKVLKQLVDEIIKDQLDHYDLNKVTVDGFPQHMPTAENMVMWIRKRLQAREIRVCLLRLWETPTSYVEWRE